eukprot:TRINITY_DN21991_c0_g1_i1.p1 TRINITY_DN21991_c0_g1~~TRINITY_DN21991_c0_g1_i1.p1  ORF type:complete len:764 (-),score=152.25 TRINITY_DN21991_c0_g1_i1:242-2371(-)
MVLPCARLGFSKAWQRAEGGSTFVRFGRLISAWTLHAEVDEVRAAAAVATLPPHEWAQAREKWQLDARNKGLREEREDIQNSARTISAESFEDPGRLHSQTVRDERDIASDGQALKRDPLELVQSVVKTLMSKQEAAELTRNSSDATRPEKRGVAAAGAFITLAAGMVSKEAASLLESAMLTKDAAARVLSGASMTAVEAAVKALSSGGSPEGMPALLASSLFLVSAVAAMGGGGISFTAGEAPGGYAEALQANSTFQELWERGTGSLGTRASTFVKEATKLSEVFDRGNLAEEAARADSQMRTASLGIAVRGGSARRQSQAWILPLEAQLFRRNEGRHATVLRLCRQLLFRSLHGISEADFEGEAGKLYEERARLIFRSLQLPLDDDRTLQRLEARVGHGSWQPLPPTDAYGLIEANVRFADSDLTITDKLTGKVSVEVRLIGSRQEEHLSPKGAVFSPIPTAVPAKTVAHLVGEEGLGVISDIDDTVKVTEVFHGVTAVLRNTFLKTFKPVHGMASLFKGWQEAQGASFHYVSKSPPELFEPLSEFLEQEGFPVSSLHLCPLLGKSRANFKLRQVTSLLKQFPGRKFLLVGDSGEKDAEIYAALLRENPGQVLKAFIRLVAPDDSSNVARVKAAFDGLPSEKWQVFAEPAEITLPQSPETTGWALPWQLRLPSKAPKVESIVEATVNSLRRFGWKPSTASLAGVVVD